MSPLIAFSKGIRRGAGPLGAFPGGVAARADNAGAAKTTRFFVHWWGRSDSQNAWTGFNRRRAAGAIDRSASAASRAS